MASDQGDQGTDPEDIAVLEIEDSIDLHGFQPRDVVNVVEDYLEAALQRGFREVRLIHGRGKGVQRARIRSLLQEHPLVVHFTDAPATRGGWGATLVYLADDAEALPKAATQDSAAASAVSTPVPGKNRGT